MPREYAGGVRLSSVEQIHAPFQGETDQFTAFFWRQIGLQRTKGQGAVDQRDDFQPGLAERNLAYHGVLTGKFTEFPETLFS